MVDDYGEVRRCGVRLFCGRDSSVILFGFLENAIFMEVAAKKI
jgi:hypothetical protein